MLPYHARHRQSTRPAVTRPSPRSAEPLAHRETRKHEHHDSLQQHAGGLKPPPAGRLRRATNPPSLMQRRTQLPHYLMTASFVRGTRTFTPNRSPMPGVLKGGACAIASATRPEGAPLTGLPWRATPSEADEAPVSIQVCAVLSAVRRLGYRQERPGGIGG